MFKKVIFTAVFIFSLATEAASYKGSIEFTEAEKQTHLEKIENFKEVAGECLQRHKTEHLEFYKETCEAGKCLSKFYGDRRYADARGKTRADGKPLKYIGDALVEAGYDPAYAKDMKGISCVGLAMRCTAEAFEATGQKAQWLKIRAFTKLNGTGGTAMQHALQALGWKVYFWNPYQRAEDLERWDFMELGDAVPEGTKACGRLKRKPVRDKHGVLKCPWESRGYHAYNYRMATGSRKLYYINKIDDSRELVGFGSTSPRLLDNQEFWIGTANGGYHVFPGTFSNVVEAHSTRPLHSIDNLEFSIFNPLATGGGPRWSAKEKYLSGMVALPPAQ